MNCKICLKEIPAKGKNKYPSYHDTCFRKLFGSLKISPQLEMNRKDFITTKARQYSRGMSISGAQPKLSMKIQDDALVITNHEGEFIAKPSPEEFPHAAENEHLSMQIASTLGLETPPNGLVQFTDGENVYIIKRYDRTRQGKLHQEDMAQAMGVYQDDDGKYKYESKSYEDIGTFLSEHLSPLDAFTFLKSLIVNFLLGNGDAHLKNFSILDIGGDSNQKKLAPAYDILNTELFEDPNELALDLFKGDFSTPAFKHLGFISRADFDELGKRFGIADGALETFYKNLSKQRELTESLVDHSPLPALLKSQYKATMADRYKKLFSKSV